MIRPAPCELEQSDWGFVVALDRNNALAAVRALETLEYRPRAAGRARDLEDIAALEAISREDSEG